MLPHPKNIDERFIYTGQRRKYVSFPLGGIGTGSGSLTGNGRLIDWSIRNRPAIDQFNGYTHFAIKAEQDGELLGARVLNGPYEGTPAGSPSARKFDGFGFGANRDSMAGVPHFEGVTFVGRLPVALFEVSVENDTGAPIDYTIAATLGNYGCDSGIHIFTRKNGLNILHFT